MKRRFWHFSTRTRIATVDHPVRLVVLWKVIRMVLVYRHRWTGIETLHRDGKQRWCLGACQVYTGQGQTRHVYLVSAAPSLVMRSLQRHRPYDWTRHTLTTIGEVCRVVPGELLERLVDWIVDKLSDDH